MHAKHVGAPLRDFALLVTLAEGFELLTEILNEFNHTHPDWTKLQSDAAIAIATENPWYVLEHFHFKGFQILRQSPEPPHEARPATQRLDS